MDAISAISGRSVPRTAAPAAVGGEADIEDMILALEQDALNHKIALRVQEIGMRSQPLSKIDVTDLALMIVSGSAMSRVLDTVQAQSPFGAGLPAGYGAGF